jgi:riboflavin synthase
MCYSNAKLNLPSCLTELSITIDFNLMFTGIITQLGKIESLDFNQKKDLLLEISSNQKMNRKLEIGCSIACNGICLTLISKKNSSTKTIFAFQASDETCKKTNLKNWKIGEIINLEFALRAGDELGGHMVLGHVDDVAKVKSIKKIKDSHQFIFETKKDLMKFIAPKGSITLNGVSLTVNEVTKNNFSVNIIKHTLDNTNFLQLKTSDLVNLEIDVIARYIMNASQRNRREK